MFVSLGQGRCHMPAWKPHQVRRVGVIPTVRCTSAQRLQSPAEIVWLNGAPGSGKGTNTPFILESRGLSRAVTMCVTTSLLPRFLAARRSGSRAKCGSRRRVGLDAPALTDT